MQNWNKVPRFFLILILLIGLCAGVFAPHMETVDASPLAANALDVIINEVAWGGTAASASDEWIELYNTTSSSIDLTNWQIVVLDGTPATITIPSGTIPPNGYFLLERAEKAVNDLTANYVYGGSNLSNTTGETLTLLDNSPTPNVIDTANISGGDWDAGSGSPNYNSMERVGVVADSASAWVSNDSITRNGLDANGNPINGTPKQQNSASYYPLMLLINEVAWAGTVASSDDEWIELHNPGATNVVLDGWRLVADDGSPDITLSGTITTGGYYLLERGHAGVTNQTHNLIFFGALSDTNEILRLRAPDGTIVDTANSDGGAWPAGIISPASSMERVGTIADGNLSWSTFQGTGSTFDAGNHLINGTPGFANIMLGITPTFTPSITPSPTNTFTPTPTPTLTPSSTPTPAGLRSVIINEVAWAGTASGLSDDEWIELYNPGNTLINLTGWNLKAADGTPDIVLSGSIPAGGYFLLERGANLSDDTTVSDLPADQIYTGNALSNSGEELTLYDGSNEIIDTANDNGGSWPAGSSSTYGTMERNDVNADSDSAWHTNTGVKKNGKNANGGDILGTPKNSNTAGPTSTPTRTATPVRTPTPVPYVIDPRPILNEILPRPGFDWNQDGRMDVFDEFIEIKNLSPIDINLSGWILDDEENTGSSPFVLPDVTLKPGQRRVFYGLQTNILLSDGGDSVRLIHPNGKIYDAYTYSIAKAADQSICRLPDGNVFGGWYEDCIPTPNLTNTREGIVPSMPQGGYESPVCDLPDTLPADFFFAECHSYGANIWNSFYWDQNGWQGPKFIPENMSKWESFIE